MREKKEVADQGTYMQKTYNNMTLISNKQKVILIALSWIILSCGGHENKQEADKNFGIKFNSKDWKNGNLYLRGRMVQNLMDDSCLINLKQDSVIKLLGKPDDTSKLLLGYIVKTKDTTPLDNHLLIYVKVDSVSRRVKEFWLTD